MKKYILTFILIGIVLLLPSFTFNANNCKNEVNVVAKTIEGHKYIIATNFSHYSGRPGGVAIIHAESCNCKKHLIK